MKKQQHSLGSVLLLCASTAVLFGCRESTQVPAKVEYPVREGQLEPREVARQPAAVKSSSPPPQTCAARASQLDEWLNALEAESTRSPVLFPTELGERLVPYQGGKVNPLPVVELMPERVSLEGRFFDADAKLPMDLSAQVAALMLALAELRRTHALLHPGDAPLAKVALAIDRDVPWRDVALLTANLSEAGFLEVDLLFATRLAAGRAAPPISSIDPDLAALATIDDPSRKAVKLGELAQRVFAPCPEAGHLFIELSRMDPPHRLPHLQANLPAAVKSCDCGLEIEAMQALLFGVWGTPASLSYSAVSRQLARAGDPARVLTQPGATQWSEAYRSMVAAAAAQDRLAVALVTTPGETPSAEPTYVLRLSFHRPVKESARKFLRQTGRRLYRSPSTGAFYTHVGERELREIFGLEVTVTVLEGAGNSSHIAARFQKIRQPQALKPGLRALIGKVELEDDPKFELMDDSIEYHSGLGDKMPISGHKR